MQAHDPNASDDPIERWSHRFWLIVPVLLLLACCWWSRVWAYLPPLRALWVNHLDQVQGQATLVAPGQWLPGGAHLAPDGRRMVLSWQREAQREAFVWDLTTDQRLPLPLPIHDIRWLDADHLAFIGRGYHIIDVRDGSNILVEPFPETSYRKPGGFTTIETMLRTATQFYVIWSFGGASGYVVIIQRQGQWELVDLRDSEQFGLSRDELEAALNAIPHIDVPEHGWGRPIQTYQRVYSPDRRFYTLWENVDIFEKRRVAIYTRDDTLVAAAFKDEWFPYVLGWAHDSSGVYFQLTYEHAPTAVVPEAPLFKLSPTTPEQARWAAARQIAGWVGGGALLAGVGWWLWRRKPRARA